MSRDDDLIADFLLGEQEPDQRAAVEARIATDPAFAEAVERMRPVVAALEQMPALGWPDGEPPALPALPPLPGLARPRRLRALAPRPALAIAATVVVLAVGIGVGAWVGSRDDGGPAGPALALGPVDDGAPGARGEARVVGAGDGGLSVQVSGLAPSPAGEFYELWLMDGPTRLVSLGSFRVPASGAAEVAVPLPVPLRDFAFIDVSVEREDGDPAHSGESVLRGSTSLT